MDTMWRVVVYVELFLYSVEKTFSISLLNQMYLCITFQLKLLKKLPVKAVYSDI
jgi:hypothetical protein